MPVSFHEDMHVAIWSWIRGWCERREEHPYLRQTPGDVLRWLIWKIGNCGGDEEESEHPFVVDGGEEDWRGGIMFKFAEKVCEVGQQLFDEGLQEKMSWKNMKMILEYYLDDCTQYIDRINSLGWTHHQINDFFELGIDWQRRRMQEEQGHTIDEFCNLIIWDRYITGDKVWDWSVLNQRFHGYTSQEQRNDLSRTWVYWVSEDKNLWNLYTGPLDPNVPFTLGESDLEEEDTDLEDTDLEEEVETIELTEQQKKKNDALRKIQETLDEVQEDLGDGLYLQLMDLMKTQYVVSS